MCGIVGYLNLNGSPVDPAGSHLAAMCASIMHRGPDEQGARVIGPAALGMTRLSIIDLKTGQQPIANEDKTVWIVFNGEIYNFQELQKHVTSKGHTLATESDTETIVHLYEEYGVDCLRFLEGMFAFAIWDTKRERLFLARDRMGEKPLHWGIFDKQLLFGSELKGILSHPNARRELDTVSLQKYLSLDYVPAPDSMFKGMHKLLPAHYMIVERGKVQIERYWEPQTGAQLGITEGEAQEKLIELLQRSIDLRLIADVPLGIFLSGGIDSSTIAALAARQSSKPIETFSIGFADQSFDESSHAQTVAEHIGSRHHCVTFEPRLAYKTMQDLFKILDEPIADASILPTFFLSRMTKKSVTVALSGEGGDELFGGYPTYQAHKMAAIWNRLPSPLRDRLFEPLIRSLPVSLNNLSIDYKLKRFIASAEQPPIRRHLRWMGSLPLKEQTALIRYEVLEAARKERGGMHWTAEEDLFDKIDLGALVMPGRGVPANVVDMIMRLDLLTYLPDDLLVKSDRASMAASLEVRLPFLAHPLVEFALSLPSDLKLRGMTTKYLLKKAVAPYLPRQIIKRPKKGFGIPVGKWLNGDFKPLVEHLLSDDFVRKQGLFNEAYIGRLLQQHRDGRADRRKELWNLLIFQWWYERFFLSPDAAYAGSRQAISQRVL